MRAQTCQDKYADYHMRCRVCKQRAPAQAMAPKIDLKMLIMRSPVPAITSCQQGTGAAKHYKKVRKDPRKHHEETVCPTVIPLEHTRLVPTTNIQLTGEAGASSSASERFRRREKACGVLPNCIESNLRSCMIVLAYMSAHAHAFDAMCEGIRNACFICRFDGLVCRTWSYM